MKSPAGDRKIEHAQHHIEVLSVTRPRVNSDEQERPINPSAGRPMAVEVDSGRLFSGYLAQLSGENPNDPCHTLSSPFMSPPRSQLGNRDEPLRNPMSD